MAKHDKGEVVVVTRAASGMDRAICQDLFDLGVEVYGLDLEKRIPY